MTPHDEFFKSVFSDLGHARDFLQGVLPPEVVRLLDLSQLSPEPTSFISDALKETLADLLFVCPLQESQAVVAILLEHKSWNSIHPHLQVLRYMVGIWDSDQASGKPFRLVIPILVHQGPYPWKIDSFAQSFPALPEGLWRFIPRVELIVEDLVQTPDARLQGAFHDPFVQVSLSLMKHIFSSEGTLAVARTLNPHLGDLDGERARRALNTLLEYILRSGDAALRNTLIQSLHPSLKERSMTIADVLRQEGKAEGKAEGKVEGIHASKLEAARKMLARGYDWAAITDITGIRPEDLEGSEPS